MPQALSVFLRSSLRWSVHCLSGWVTKWAHFPGFMGMPALWGKDTGHHVWAQDIISQHMWPGSHHACVGCAHFTSLQQSERWKSNGGKWKLQMGFFFFCWSILMNKRSRNYSVLWGFIYVSCGSVFVSVHVRACGCVDSRKSVSFYQFRYHSKFKQAGTKTDIYFLLKIKNVWLYFFERN